MEGDKREANEGSGAGGRRAFTDDVCKWGWRGAASRPELLGVARHTPRHRSPQVASPGSTCGHTIIPCDASTNESGAGGDAGVTTHP